MVYKWIKVTKGRIAMSAGHLLSEGQYINKNVSEDELWSAFSRLFESMKKSL